MMATQIAACSGRIENHELSRFVDNDTAGSLAITAKMIGYDRSASALVVPIGKATAAAPVQRKISDAKKPVISYSAATKTLSLNIARTSMCRSQHMW